MEASYRREPGRTSIVQKNFEKPLQFLLGQDFSYKNHPYLVWRMVGEEETKKLAPDVEEI